MGGWPGGVRFPQFQGHGTRRWYMDVHGAGTRSVSPQKLENWSMPAIITRWGRASGFPSMPEADLRCFRGPPHCLDCLVC